MDTSSGSITRELMPPPSQPTSPHRQNVKCSKCSKIFIYPGNLENHKMTCSERTCPLCGYLFSDRFALKMHKLSKTACLKRIVKSQANGHIDKVASKTKRPRPSATERKTFRRDRQAISTNKIELPPMHSLAPPLPRKILPLISNLIHPGSSGWVENGEVSDLNRSTPEAPDASSHRVNTKVSTTESERILVEDPVSPELIVTEPLKLDDIRGNSQPSPKGTEDPTEQQVDSTNPSNAIVPRHSREERTEQPGYVTNWVDSTYAIQSPLSGSSGDGMTSWSSEFGIGYEAIRATSESEEDGIDTDNESFVWTEYSENSPEWDPSGAILAPMKQKYIERLLFSFSLVQRQWRSPAASDQGSDPSTGSRSWNRHATSSAFNNNSENRPPKRSKRQSANGGDGDGQGDDDDGNDSENTPPNISENGQGTRLHFACPFVKRYPRHYDKCYSHELKNVSRVKYHLFRAKAHRLPIYCPNCSETFSREDKRDDHVREAKCTKKPQIKWEGITAEKREQLEKRSSSKSEVENWNAVYRILFPDSPLPRSPYIEISLSGGLLPAFREHFESNGRSVWNEIVRTHIPENLRPYLEEIQSFHHSFYPEFVATALESWNPRYSTTRSLQPQPSLLPARQETERFVDPTSTTVESRSDSALGNSAADGSQSGIEPTSASQNGVPTHTQQQQSTIQQGPQAVFHQQMQPALGVPHFTPPTPSFIPRQNTGAPLYTQYPFGSTGQIEHGLSPFLHQPPQAPSFTPGLGQSLDAQYASGSAQPGPDIWQFQIQQPQGDFPQGSSYQPHQTQIQSQFSSHMSTPLPSARIPGLGDQPSAQRTHDLLDTETLAMPIYPSSGWQMAQSRDWYWPPGGI